MSETRKTVRVEDAPELQLRLTHALFEALPKAIDTSDGGRVTIIDMRDPDQNAEPNESPLMIDRNSDQPCIVLQFVKPDGYAAVFLLQQVGRMETVGYSSDLSELLPPVPSPYD